MLPNVIIIGAAKAGTSSLHYYLGLHPHVAAAWKKEVRFFSHRENWTRGVEWYADQFTDAPVRLEASPSYTAHPQLPDTAARMARTVPDARLIYIVRDPVLRAISHYYFAYANGRESEGFEKAIRNPLSRFVAQSQYWMQIEQYLQFFDRSQILVLEQEAMGRDVRGTLARVYAFLNLEAPPDSPLYDVRLNESRRRRRRGRTAHRLAQLNKLAPVRAVPIKWRMRFGRLAYWPVTTSMPPRPPLDDAVRAHLVERLTDDAARFRVFTGQPFKEWTV